MITHASSFWSLISEVDDLMREIADAIAAGRISPEAWFRAMERVIVDGHGAAYKIGTQMGGSEVSPGVWRLFARERGDEEAFFLSQFMEAIRRGRYNGADGRPEVSKIMNRARLYSGKMRGSANRGFVDGSPAGARYLWVLGSSDPCSDCPELAAISAANPFVRDTMFQYPGDGSTPCLGNCKCHLVRLDDGATSIIARTANDD